MHIAARPGGDAGVPRDLRRHRPARGDLHAELRRSRSTTSSTCPASCASTAGWSPPTRCRPSGRTSPCCASWCATASATTWPSCSCATCAPRSTGWTTSTSPDAARGAAQHLPPLRTRPPGGERSRRSGQRGLHRLGGAGRALAQRPHVRPGGQHPRGCWWPARTAAARSRTPSASSCAVGALRAEAGASSGPLTAARSTPGAFGGVADRGAHHQADVDPSGGVPGVQGGRGPAATRAPTDARRCRWRAAPRAPSLLEVRPARTGRVPPAREVDRGSSDPNPRYGDTVSASPASGEPSRRNASA